MKSLDEGIHHTLVIGLLHPRLQLLRFQDGIITCRILENVMHHLHQLRLRVGIFQIMNHEVLNGPPLIVHRLVDGDGPLVDQFQDTGRKEVVVISTYIFIGILHIVRPLKVSVVGNVAIPEQILHHLLPCPPHVIEIARNQQDGHQEEECHEGE